MLDKLRPVSGEHSIFRSIASVFIPQQFLRPEDIFEKTKQIESFENYPKKSLAKATTININNNSLGISNEQVNGFLFENYDQKGSIKNIFKLENKENRAILSLETRKYSEWKIFKDQWISDLDSFSKKNDFYLDAISLNYRDEFIWSGTESIPVKEIFDIDSELLNEKFLNSRNGPLVLISQVDTGGLKNEEKTEVSFNNDIKRITIDHQFAIRFNSFQLFEKLKESDKLGQLFDIAHKENKNILKNVLAKEVQDLIKLN